MATPRQDPAPRVSVAISTFNRAHIVGRAIRSALAQTFAGFELIVVDDGSTDATHEILAGLDDRRLRRVRHERNHGISRTRNTALGLAQGEWLAFLDDDNEWAPDYLERLLAFAASRPGAGVIYCQARQRDARSGLEVEAGGLWQGQVFCSLVAGWNPFVSSALICTAILREAGGLDERFRVSEDIDMWLRLAQCTAFAGTGETLLIRHVGHGPQLSRDPDLLRRDAQLLAQKWRTVVSTGCGRSAYLQWRLRLLLKAKRRGLERAAMGHGIVARLLRPALVVARHVAKALHLSSWL